MYITHRSTQIVQRLLLGGGGWSHSHINILYITKNFGAVPGTLFIYFVIFLTIHTLFFLGMFSCWVFLLPELGK